MGFMPIFFTLNMAKTKQKEIENIIKPVIETLGFELWGIDFFGSMRPALLRIFIDRTEGYVSLDDCTRVSREISAVLDVEDLIVGNYKLEVSSPGLERPLFKIEHFRRFIGQNVQIRLFAPENGRRKFNGIIKEVKDDTIIITTIEDNTERVFVLPFEKIEKANLSIKF
jgi:ribosome maturation factor RimP